MLAEKFFEPIDDKLRIGLVKFKNGHEMFLDLLNVDLVPSGYSISCSDNRKPLDIQYGKDWKVIRTFPEQEHPEDWSIVSAEFVDMGHIVEEVAAGRKSGYFYTAVGEKIRADKSSVFLEKSIIGETTGFTVKTDVRGFMYYRMPKLANMYCSHGQIPRYNIIDFISD